MVIEDCQEEERQASKRSFNFQSGGRDLGGGGPGPDCSCRLLQGQRQPQRPRQGAKKTGGKEKDGSHNHGDKAGEDKYSGRKDGEKARRARRIKGIVSPPPSTISSLSIESEDDPRPQQGKNYFIHIKKYLKALRPRVRVVVLEYVGRGFESRSLHLKQDQTRCEKGTFFDCRKGRKTGMLSSNVKLYFLGGYYPGPMPPLQAPLYPPRLRVQLGPGGLPLRPAALQLWSRSNGEARYGQGQKEGEGGQALEESQDIKVKKI